jgi:predicted transcriptional regulator
MPLPSAIEAALIEAGFSGSELAILKRLLEDDALSLREIASKAGKSTGALDQALKKLISKEIVTKEEINGSQKYVLGSLDAIRKWIEKDTKEKQSMLQRRHDNVEAFLSSITQQKQRPDLQHFVGIEAMKQAYAQLLSYGALELLHFLPEPQKEEDDPLHEFNVQFFRLRRQKNIFSRVLANNTPLGRRYQSRDPFEFRKTVLLPVGLTTPFEKIIVGNTVACFDHEKMSACFIHYPELANTERAQFEHAWSGQPGLPSAVLPPKQIETIDQRTKILSSMRSFFLGKVSFYSFLGFGLLSCALTFGLYGYDRSTVTERLQEKAMAIASTAAPSIRFVLPVSGFICL